MLSAQLRKLIRPLVIIQQVIWLVITGSIVFYFGIIYLLVGDRDSDSPSMSGDLKIALYVAAILVAAASFYLRNYFLSDESLRRFLAKDLNLEELARDPGKDSPDSQKLERLRSLSVFEQKIFSLMYYIQKTTFINLFLNEIVVIIGFVLAFLSGDPGKIIPFGAVSLLLCIWMYPRSGKITERARQLYSMQ
jgi:hypothetical protein